MKTLSLLMCSIALVACGPGAQKSVNTTSDGKLVRAQTSLDISAFEAAFRADNLDIHSIMVLQHGQVVAERWWSPGAPDSVHILNSVSKSFAASAVGFAVAEGLLSLDDKVAGFFPDKMPASPSTNLEVMTVRDLLTMSTGQAQEPNIRESGDWVGGFLAAPVDDTPGATFRYNSMATFMLSAIVQKVSGQKLTDYLEPRLFAPLGISGYRWLENPEGIPIGGWGLYVKTEDMAKFGQLFLQNGVWNGRQVLPAGWVEQASARQIANGPVDAPSDWTQGYGFQMWRSRHNSYRADGANGQYILVLPELDAVVAITAHLQDMQRELNLVWKHILPLLRGGSGPAYGVLDRAGLPDKSFDQIFSPVEIGAVPESVFKLVGEDFTVLTAGTEKDYNSMVAGWGGWGILFSKPVTWCMLRANRYTLEYMRREGRYTMCYFDEEQKSEIMIFGTSSGRGGDKMSRHTLLPVATPGGSMAYKEAKLVIECTLTEVTTVSPDDFLNEEGRAFVTEAHAEAGDWHKLVFGTVSGVWIRK